MPMNNRILPIFCILVVLITSCTKLPAQVTPSPIPTVTLSLTTQPSATHTPLPNQTLTITVTVTITPTATPSITSTIVSPSKTGLKVQCLEVSKSYQPGFSKGIIVLREKKRGDEGNEYLIGLTQNRQKP
jgi:hypothetical protein